MNLVSSLVEAELKNLSERWNDLIDDWRDNAAAAKRSEVFGPADTLVRAFLAGYRPKEEALRKAADQRIQHYGALVAAGREAVEIYRRGDDTSALQFPASG